MPHNLLEDKEKEPGGLPRDGAAAVGPGGPYSSLDSRRQKTRTDEEGTHHGHGSGADGSVDQKDVKAHGYGRFRFRGSLTMNSQSGNGFHGN